MNEINRTVSSRLRNLRESVDMKQGTLARHLGVAQSTVCNWEHGIRNLTPSHVEDICEVFKVTPDYLFGFTTIKNQGAVLAQALDELARLKNVNCNEER